MLSVTLFHLEREDIKIDISAYFQGDALVIDGYDIGKSVEQYWGDSDYEYTTTIRPPGVVELYRHFGVIEGRQEELLKAIASQYNTNTCYSEFGNLLDKLKIKYEGFSWT